MTTSLLNWLQDLGTAGLFAAMFLEGSSLPFPGIVVALGYGYLVPSANVFWTGAGMSVVYSLASLIPFLVGRKLGTCLPSKWQKGLEKAGGLFRRYGYWSVALTRPFGLGNYISYVAGMSKMSVTSYLCLTFLGIYPWSCSMLWLGKHGHDYWKVLRSAFRTNGDFFLGAGTAAVLTMLVCLSLATWKRSRAGSIPRKGERGHA